MNEIEKYIEEKKLNGKILQKEIFEELNEKAKGKNIKFCIISIGKDEPSRIYINQKKKMAEKIGYICENIKYSEDVSQDQIISKIRELNADKSVSGIMVQLPIPRKFDENEILNTIDFKKDIDGLTKENLARLVNNEPGIFPATPSGIVYLLEKYGIDLAGKDILIINRSKLVGKPLGIMLLNKDATITIAHSKTNNLKNKILSSDIIISATGNPENISKMNLENSESIEDKIFIDVGVSRVQGKICGDIPNIVKEKCLSTPSIGGVGPLTIAFLAKNIYKSYELNN